MVHSIVVRWNKILRSLLLLSFVICNNRQRNNVFVLGIISCPTSTRGTASSGWGVIPRGGSNSEHSNVTVEDYVAAVEEKDAQHRNPNNDSYNDDNSNQDGLDEDEHKSKEHTSTEGHDKTHDKSIDPESGVGVKSHSSKKSNAVGDPDGDDDDSDADDTTTSDDWDDLEEELEDLLVDSETQLQVEVELVEENHHNEENSSSAGNSGRMEASSSGNTGSVGGGGVGVRLGQRLGHRRRSRNSKANSSSSSSHHPGTVKSGAIDHQHMLNAWLPHVYLPPSAKAIEYLVSKARNIDSSSKIRLDRRTLYAGLLLEWLQLSASYRKFMDPKTSQALQAALSLASQPQWRQAFPRPSAFKMYDDSDSDKGCTLAMQETIAMALAHSLGSAMVIVDDETFHSIRKELLRMGYADEDVKPAALFRRLLDLAKNGNLCSKAGGSISACMKRDLHLGLDDPYDDHATTSCTDMKAWEEEWCDMEGPEKPVPLVIFLRTQAANSLLKSKSAVEAIMQECASNESLNLVVFGKGIDATTMSLPHETHHEGHHETRENFPNQRPGAAPWFGFSPQNQNASGQNDPEGSRRFNIFLARQVDNNGNLGILGAIAPPQAGNLFPHMSFMMAREKLQQHDDDSAIKAELERWTQLLQQQMQSNAGNPLPPPQFFNATLSTVSESSEKPKLMPPPNMPVPPPEVIQQTLQQAMSELLDRLAQAGETEDSSELSPDLHKAFGQILRNENLRQGIADNLARAAPALADPKCQGVMLSVYVPPPPDHVNRGKLPGQSHGKSSSNVGGWFHKILNNQESSQATENEEQDEAKRKSNRQKRVRTMAAAAAVMAAKNAEEANNSEKQENKAERNLSKLESLCKSITVKSPTDPVRAKSWEAWIARERGAVVFRHNRRALNKELEHHNLSLQQHTGTLGAGSALRQMLSARDITDEMESVIKCAVELEAAKSQRLHETPDEMHEHEMDLEVDMTLSQLLVSEDGAEEVISSTKTSVKHKPDVHIKYLHPSSIETALSLTCRISPSPTGGLTASSTPASHRSKEEISALAQDKHERALVSQVVSPQDIGVTYDMIGGLTDVKELLRQSITYPLKFPHLYSEGIAREAVKGVLLFGPPGTGKTMLAKAVATEGGASFLSVDASSVENKWLGESEKNAKAVFTLARRLAPCVIFIDEVDSLLSSREGTSDDSAHGTLTSVKTTMMSEWDGLNSGTNGSGEAGSDRVVVIGSTNRPFDLDEAVLRRFPRRILVDLPDLETRTEILEVTLAENRLDPEVNLTKIAERLEGYTGSDIKEVCREAVVQISHEQAKILDQGLVSGSSSNRQDVTQGILRRLRPVTTEDFDSALSKLKRSVSEKGRELARVWEWNDEYGEIKKEKKNHLPHLMNMYL